MKITGHKKVLFVTILFLLFTFLLANSATAQDSTKVTAGDHAQLFAFFGQTVGVSETLVVVGAPALFTPERIGAAYVFTRTDDGYDAGYRLTVDDSPGFGWSVSAGGNGNIVAVGAPFTGEGVVYVFSRTDDGWDDGYPLTVDGASGFGWSVSIADDGNTLVVGAPGEGKTYVFTRTGDTWPKEPDATLAADGDPGYFFGGFVATDGNRVVVGARSLDPDIYISGKAYVFTRTGDTWSEIPDATLSPGGSVAAPYFGGSVSISGDNVAVAAPGSLPSYPTGELVSGFVYVYGYDQDSSDWNPEDTLELPASASGFGFSVAISGDRLAVSAPADVVDEVNGAKAGAVYLFIREVNGDETNWVPFEEQPRVIAFDGDGMDGDKFGWSVALDDDTLAVGAPLGDIGDDGFINTGAAYVYTLPSANEPPTADAGPDQKVVEGKEVWLDGSNSFDPDGDDIIFIWEQINEPKVVLDVDDPARPSFFAPPVEDGCIELVFQLTVKDWDVASEPDTVLIRVFPNNEIHSTLKDKHRHWIYWHKYSFYGNRNDKVTINLKADLNGWHRGSRVTLILKDKIRGKWLREAARGDLPATITAELPADGEYAVYVFKQPWFWFWRRNNSFEGDYVLTLDGTCGKLAASSGCKKK